MYKNRCQSLSINYRDQQSWYQGIRVFWHKSLQQKWWTGLSQHSFSACFLLLIALAQLMVSEKYIHILFRYFNIYTILKFTIGAIPRLPVDLLLSGDGSQFNSKIVGGSEASIGEFPFQISLQRFGGLSWSHICGGSIFNQKTILNAAHCVSGYIRCIYHFNFKSLFICTFLVD